MFVIRLTGVLLMMTVYSAGYKITWDNEVDVDLNEIDDDLGRSDERRVPNWFFIYPGR